MSIKWIVINGIRNSGRRYAANYIRRSLAGLMDAAYLEQGHNRTRGYDGEALVIGESFNAPVKHLIATLLGVTYLEEDRYKMRPELNGYSIDMFRDYVIQQMRDQGGDDILGRCLVHRVLRNPAKRPHFVVIDDGNIHDITALQKPIVIRLTRMDKRFTVQETGFVPEPMFKVENNDQARTFRDRLDNVISSIVREHVND